MSGSSKNAPHRSREPAGKSSRVDPYMRPEPGFWEWDLENNSIWVTENIKELIDTADAGEAVQKCFLSTVHPDDADRVREAIGATLKKDDPLEIEYRARAGGGDWQSYHMSARIRIREGGKARALVGTLQPRETPANQPAPPTDPMALQDFLRNVPAVIYQRLLTADGRILYPFISDHISEILGVDPAAVMNAPNRCFGEIHPDDKGRFDREMEASRQTLSRWETEFRIIGGDGKYHWVKSMGNPRRLPDGGTLWDCVLFDVSARKQIEVQAKEQTDYLRLILENVSVAVVTADEAGRIEIFNPAAAGIFGYGAEEMIGRNISRLMARGQREKHDRALDQYMNTGTGRILNTGPREV
ncbi:MAG: PAS domain-containing protein, partial [Alphaproteobacteria bacterium]|nr:PAS domain-containing protein [Alphaproteobacteria bacterium]